MHDIYVDVIGYIGGGLLGVQSIPQIFKICKTKSTNDISLLFVLTNLCGLSCMTYFAVYTNQTVLYIPTTTSLMLSSVVLVLKICYDTKLPPHNTSVQIEL